ncbi:MAG TPA: ATP-binding cassette domain-containing protein, partial [Caldimonas sp.]|nr:ATP-binding cassette domain-containing protein [Caldimonas sp.]
DLSVAEALAFLLRIHGHAGDDRTVDGALAHWGLLERRDVPVRTLSPGLRRRVALARLSVHPSAAIWILDEPFDSLDADGVERLNAQLARQLAAGGAVLFTGHEPRLAPGLVARTLDLDAEALRTSVPEYAFEPERLVLRPAGRKLQLHGS